MDIDNFALQCRALIPDGITLLENDGALPLKEGEKVAVFGRGQYEYLKSGSGSGGLVQCAYTTNVAEELKKRVAVDKEIDDFFRQYIAENPIDNGDGWYVSAFSKTTFFG